jgi:hypothetical protein
MIKFNEWLKKKLDEVGGATSVVWGHNKKDTNVGPDAQAEGAPWSMNKKHPSGVKKSKK